MSEINTTISTFGEDSIESYISCGSDILKIQNIECENQRLKEINTKLEAEISSFKKQLMDSVDSSALIKSSSESLKLLKQQVAELTQKNEKLLSQNKELKDSINNKDSEILKNNSKYEDEIKNLENKLIKVESKNKKLKTELNDAKDDIIQKENLLILLTEKLKKKSSLAKKLNQKMEKINSSNEENNQRLFASNQRIEYLESEIQNITNNLTEADANANELKLEISKKNNEINEIKKSSLTINSSFSILEGQLQEQKGEIEAISAERIKLLNLTSTLQKALTKATDLIHDLRLEKSLSSPAKAVQAPTIKTGVSENEVNELKLPFEGELRDNLEKILLLPQYQPIQKVQLIINELFKVINECDEEVRAFKNREIIQSEPKNDKFACILSAFLAELSKIVSDFNLPSSQQSITDKKFIQFLSSKLAEIDPVLKENITNDSLFVPNDFFSSETNWIKQMEEVEEISNKEKTSYAIIVSQFLLNKVLRKSIGKNVHSEEEEVKTTEREIKEPVFASNSSDVEQLNSQVASLEEEKNKLKKTLKTTKDRLINVNKLANEHKTEVAKLQLELNSTRNELDLCKMKLDISASKNSSMIDPPIMSIKEFFNESSISNESNEELNKIKEQLSTKTQEVESLKKENETLNEKVLFLSKQQQKQIKKLKDRFIKEKNAIQESFDVFMTKNSKQIKTNSKKYKQEKAKDTNMITSLSEQLEISNNELTKAQRDVQQKNEEIKTVKETYNNTINDLNEKIASLDSNINELSNQKKQFELEISNIKQQSVKENQNIQCKLSAQTMAYQTKLQQMQQEINYKIQNSLQSAFSVVYEEFGQMYGLEETDINEETLKQLVEVVKSDLDKLKYFQDEATRVPE